MKVQKIINQVKREDLVKWNGEKLDDKGFVFDDLVCAVRKRLREIMDKNNLDNYALILNKSHIEIYPSSCLYEVDPIIINIRKQVVKSESNTYFSISTLYTFKDLEIKGDKEITFEQYHTKCKEAMLLKENRLNNVKEQFLQLLKNNNVDIETFNKLQAEFKKLPPSVKYDLISSKK